MEYAGRAPITFTSSGLLLPTGSLNLGLTCRAITLEIAKAIVEGV